jgi:hypothetical protein
MKKVIYLCLLGLTLSMTMPAYAENRAANISLGSTGGALDNAALKTTRKLIAHAIISNTVDSFIVYSPKVGGPIFREGGLSACVEAGFSATPQEFSLFVEKLRAIHPKQGTFLNIELAANCNSNPSETESCGGITAKQCPSGKACVDDPKDSCDPAHGGADCSGLCVTNTGDKPEPPVSCGGISGRPCPDGKACVDVPNDGCDPAHGGADCIGTCSVKSK